MYKTWTLLEIQRCSTLPGDTLLTYSGIFVLQGYTVLPLHFLKYRPCRKIFQIIVVRFTEVCVLSRASFCTRAIFDKIEAFCFSKLEVVLSCYEAEVKSATVFDRHLTPNFSEMHWVISELEHADWRRTNTRVNFTTSLKEPLRRYVGGLMNNSLRSAPEYLTEMYQLYCFVKATDSNRNV
jgi:hypothetical protein